MELVKTLGELADVLKRLFDESVEDVGRRQVPHKCTGLGCSGEHLRRLEASILVQLTSEHLRGNQDLELGNVLDGRD